MASATTAIWKRPYPLSTDAPSVHLDIEALANSLETVPLFPTTATSSRTGVVGESVAVSAGDTLTLPTSPTEGDLLRVSAAAGVSGASPVTVSSGHGINGLGLSVASSFPLGTPFAHATLQFDGLNWLIIDGERDTGWLDCTPASSVTANPLLQARLKGEWVELQGGASASAAVAVLFTLPSIAIPSSSGRQVRLVVPYSAGSAPFQVSANQAGHASPGVVSVAGGTISGAFSVDGLRYPLS